MICNEIQGHVTLAIDVAKMNNEAVQSMKTGGRKSKDASTCLLQALDLLAHIQNEEFDFQEINNCLEKQYEKIKYLEGDSRRNNKQSHSNAHDYDEGMQVSPDPIQVPVFEKPKLQNIIAIVLYNLGLLHMQHNEDESSLHFFKAAFDTFKLECNRRSIHEISILHNAGYIHYRNKKFDVALVTFNKAYNLSCEIFGYEHALVASALNCIGVIIFRMGKGDHKKALHFLSQSLTIRKKILPPNHPDIATSMNNIGRVYFDAGNFAKATDAYCEALVMRKKIFGDDNIDVAATTFNAGQTFHKIGKLNEAMRHYRAYFRIASKLLGRDHGDIAIVLSCIGELYQEMKQNEKALKYYTDALKTNMETIGERNREAASLLNRIGNLHYESGDFDRAIEAYEQGLVVEKMLMHQNYANVVITLSNIGQSFLQKGDYSSALNKYTEIYRIQCIFSVCDDLNIAETLSMIGQISSSLGEYSQAQNAFLEVIHIRKKILGDHIDLALAHSYLGLVYFKQGMLDLAMINFKESLRVRQLCRSEDERDVAVLLYNIASIYLHKGDSEMALKFYKDTLAIEQAVLGENHSDVAGTLKIIGNVYDRCGIYEEAIRYYTQSLEVLRNNLGSVQGNDSEIARENKLSIARLLAVIANVHLCQADTEKMMKALVESYRIYSVVCASASELELVGFDLYELSLLHPECAPAA